MTLSRAGTPDARSSFLGGRRYRGMPPLAVALGLSLFGFLVVGLVGARPVTAAGASPSPAPTFVAGRHVYDFGNVLSANSAKTAEALAAHIEASGGGRVVIYTADQNSSLPDTTTLAASWSVDGLLLTGQSDEGQMAVGAKLKAKLGATQYKVITDNSSPAQATTESWIMSNLARADAFVSGTHIFDGAGILDASHKQQAETAATNLGNQLGDTVYVDISIGDTDPSTTAFFDATQISDELDRKSVV